ncbi:unnamed protein product [Closterium sp. Yama58-4]|nr:unnamed protein product [Closterium sp. Yama58-4]
MKLSQVLSQAHATAGYNRNKFLVFALLCTNCFTLVTLYGTVPRFSGTLDIDDAADVDLRSSRGSGGGSAWGEEGGGVLGKEHGGTPALRLSNATDRTFKRGFGMQGFVYFSAYRISASLFVVIGLSPLPLHRNLDARVCRWYPASSSSSFPILGEISIEYPGESHGKPYEVAMLFCQLSSPAPGTRERGGWKGEGRRSAGGHLTVVIEREEILMLGEPANEKLPLEPSAPYASNITYCSSTIYSQFNSLRVLEWVPSAPYPSSITYCSSPIYGQFNSLRVLEWVVYHQQGRRIVPFPSFFLPLPIPQPSAPYPSSITYCSSPIYGQFNSLRVLEWVGHGVDLLSPPSPFHPPFPFSPTPQPSAPYHSNITYCSSPIYGQFNSLRVLEWVVYHQQGHGVDLFHMYDAGGMGEPIMRTLAPFIRAEQMTVTDVTEVDEFETWFGQVLVVNDCAYRSLFTSRWVLFLDLDEYLYVSQPLGSSLITALARYDQAAYVSFGSLYFYTDKCSHSMNVSASSPPRWEVERMIFRQADVHCVAPKRYESRDLCLGFDGHRKYIADPRKVKLFGVSWKGWGVWCVKAGGMGGGEDDIPPGQRALCGAQTL